MKISELRAKTVAELEEQLINAKEEQFNLRMQRSMGQLENPSRIRTVRRDIAKIKTLITEKKNAVEVK
ncbi:50S ribosomal protein L29 [bacterium]|jgi:large subunit ribosomal protein L29|nr:50S ribosomal protein L29 [bacterium]MBR6244019.1 50S ribosomal protein L29 [bacterium]